MRWICLLVLAVLLQAFPPALSGAESGKIVYARRAGESYTLHVMNDDGTGDRELPGQTAAINLFPTVSPSGKRIAFTSGQPDANARFQVSTINTDGTGLTTLDAVGVRDARPAWSADGKLIAFSSTAADPALPGLYLWDIANGTTRQVPTNGAGAASVFWRPDGAIGYSELKPNAGSADLAYVRPDGTGREVAVEGAQLLLAGANAPSPDGKKLAYYSLDLGMNKMTLRVREVAANSEQTLSEGDGHGLMGLPVLPAAAWMPDGKSVLASVATPKGLGIFRISLEDTSKTRLTPEGVDCIHPAYLKAG
jgi:Tol biopolymer transport system component